MSVSLGTRSSRFSAAVTRDQRISVTGQVKNLRPFLTGVGGFDVDLALEVSTAAVRPTSGMLCPQGCPLLSGPVCCFSLSDLP